MRIHLSIESMSSTSSSEAAPSSSSSSPVNAERGVAYNRMTGCKKISMNVSDRVGLTLGSNTGGRPEVPHALFNVHQHREAGHRGRDVGRNILCLDLLRGHTRPRASSSTNLPQSSLYPNCLLMKRSAEWQNPLGKWMLWLE